MVNEYFIVGFFAHFFFVFIKGFTVGYINILKLDKPNSYKISIIAISIAGLLMYFYILGLAVGLLYLLLIYTKT